MRRLLTLLAASGLLLASGCGTTAQADAARVGDRSVPVAEVDALSRDAAFVQAVGGTASRPGESVVPGEVARGTLSFEIQRAALRNELDRWRLAVTAADRQAAGVQLQQLLTGPDGAPPPALGARTRGVLVDFVAARALLDRRLAAVRPTDAADLDRLYAGVPALWDRVCMTVVQAPEGTASAAAKLVRRRVRLEKWATADPRFQTAAEATSCIPRARLPRALRDSVETARPHRVVGPVVVRTDQASALFWYRIDRRSTVSRAAASKDLAELAAGLAQQGSAGWLGFVLLSDVWVNPRYGSGVELGTSGRLQVVRPDAPAPVLLPRAPVAPRGAAAPTGGSGAPTPAG